MKALSTALQTWCDQHKSISLRELAAKAGLPSGDLSRIRAGHKTITYESICKLLPAIESLSSRGQARTLLIAYLNDETPNEFAADLRIYAIDQQSGAMDRDAIAIARDRWEQRARTDAQFAAMWLLLDRSMHETETDYDPTTIAFPQAHYAQPQHQLRVAEESATGYRLTAPAMAVGAPPAAPPAPQTAAQVIAARAAAKRAAAAPPPPPPHRHE